MASSAKTTVDCFLIGIDNSDCSRRALEFAARRARIMGARVVVAYIIEWSPYSFNTPQENEVRHRRREEEIASATSSVLDPTVASMAGEGIDTMGIVRHGNVADALNTISVDQGATQIVVGRVGASALKSLVFGSVTSKLVQMATVPVTVVP